jgi:hypothetical protein
VCRCSYYLGATDLRMATAGRWQDGPIGLCPILGGRIEGVRDAPCVGRASKKINSPPGAAARLVAVGGRRRGPYSGT